MGKKEIIALFAVVITVVFVVFSIFSFTKYFIKSATACNTGEGYVLTVTAPNGIEIKTKEFYDFEGCELVSVTTEKEDHSGVKSTKVINFKDLTVTENGVLEKFNKGRAIDIKETKLFSKKMYDSPEVFKETYGHIGIDARVSPMATEELEQFKEH